MFWFLALCRFIVDLIDTISGRWQTSTDNENRLKQSVINLFVDSTKPPEEMEEFEFELLKAELLTQPMEKDGSQLFHRNTSWLRKVSEIKLPENRGDFIQHEFYGRLDSQFLCHLESLLAPQNKKATTRICVDMFPLAFVWLQWPCRKRLVRFLSITFYKTATHQTNKIPKAPHIEQHFLGQVCSECKLKDNFITEAQNWALIPSLQVWDVH